jgi:hypothetical protein
MNRFNIERIFLENLRQGIPRIELFRGVKVESPIKELGFHRNA